MAEGPPALTLLLSVRRSGKRFPICGQFLQPLNLVDLFKFTLLWLSCSWVSTGTDVSRMSHSFIKRSLASCLLPVSSDTAMLLHHYDFFSPPPKKMKKNNTKSNLCCPYTDWSMVKLPVVSRLKLNPSPPPSLPEALNCGELHLSTLITIFKSFLWLPI